jgi:hypothetical protein
MSPPMTDRQPSFDDDLPRPARASGREALLVIGGGAVLLALVVVPLLRGSKPRGERLRILIPTANSRLPSVSSVGSKVCGECHPGEYALYTRSGHARTLRRAETVPLARELDGRTVADPERAGVSWTYRLRDGRFEVERTEAGRSERIPLHYAFGSGHHAITMVTVTDPNEPSCLEHRLTYFTREDEMGVTPGQRAGHAIEGTTSRGRELDPKATLKCFGCHTTRVEGEAANDPGPMAANVSCERCHGPARAHVEAARRGRTDLTMPFGLESWTADTQLALCGQCHRHPSRVPPEDLRREDPALARFQPIGLTQSACYKASAGALSCVNCHDPHARASSKPEPYEAACLKCHGSAGQQTVCGVSPASGCLDCHMPKLDSGQGVLFTDHWIRVRTSIDPQPGQIAE